MRRLQWIQSQDAVLELLPRVETLATQVPFAQPFFRSGWIEPWMQTLAGGRRVVALVVEEGEDLCGFWPFFAYKGVACHGLWPACAQVADLVDPLWDGQEETHAALWEGLQAALDHYAFVWLPLLSERFALPDSESVEEGDYRQVTRTRQRNLWIDLSGTWEQWQEQTLSSGKRKALRRQWRRLEEQGAAFRYWGADADIPTLVRILRAIEQGSWKGRAKKGIFSLPDVARFYEKALPGLVASGEVEITTLEVAGVQVAFEIGLLQGSWYGMHSISYLEDQGAHSPGRLLMLHNIERAFARGLHTYDLLQGAQPYKQKMASGAGKFRDIGLYAPTWRGALHQWLATRSA